MSTVTPLYTSNQASQNRLRVSTLARVVLKSWRIDYAYALWTQHVVAYYNRAAF